MNIRLTDRVSNDVLMKRTRFERVEFTLRKSNDIVKGVLDWNTQGRSRRGFVDALGASMA